MFSPSFFVFSANRWNSQGYKKQLEADQSVPGVPSFGGSKREKTHGFFFSQRGRGPWNPVSATKKHIFHKAKIKWETVYQAGSWKGGKEVYR